MRVHVAALAREPYTFVVFIKHQTHFASPANYGVSFLKPLWSVQELPIVSQMSNLYQYQSRGLDPGPWVQELQRDWL